VFEADKIDSDRDKNADMKCDPEPNTCRHGSATVSRQSVDRNRKRRPTRLFSRELERSS
jgi:hypothetical protein